MIVLALLRHAKAVKDDPAGDHARRLSASGRADAIRAGEWLRRRLTGDVVILASDARRTRETATLAFPPAGRSDTLRLEPALYGASAAEIVSRVRRVETAAAVVLVGHNPGIGEAAWQLAGWGEADRLARLHSAYPPATVALLEFAAPWQAVEAAQGRLVGLFRHDDDG